MCVLPCLRVGDHFWAESTIVMEEQGITPEWIHRVFDARELG